GYKYREEEPPRATARKYDGYERRNISEKKNGSTKWPEKAMNDLPYNIASRLKSKATKARETIREKEAQAAAAKSRSKEQRRERGEKQRRTFVEDYSSDSDTATYVTVNRANQRSAAKAYDSPPQSKKPEKRSPSTKYSDDEDDKWVGLH